MQLDQLDRLVYDTFLRNFTNLHSSEEVIVVDVDEQSLAEVGQLPCPRQTGSTSVWTVGAIEKPTMLLVLMLVMVMVMCTASASCQLTVI